MTAWCYDSADRPLWQKYPGGNAGQLGEQVMFTYNTQGLLRQVQSNGSTYLCGRDALQRAGPGDGTLAGQHDGVEQLHTYTAVENFRLVTLKTGNAPLHQPAEHQLHLR
ncbi:hypothetical protein [Candidatus Amarolinea dominans]|uniref:hypothetical protein n=1 Tax=Candidatus Amarolinea dominans TaxID=3140696 RepID=UPI003136346E|nr:hypothetical protein [Anaerolineae bacterium]